MANYSPAHLPPAHWDSIAPEALCVIRRSRPTSESQVRTRLATLVGFAAWAHRGQGPLSPLLTEHRIRMFAQKAGTQKSAARTQLRLDLLRRASHGLPPASARRRTSSVRPKAPRAGTARRLTLLLAPAPVLDALRAQPLSRRQLEGLLPHMPTADLASFREVLRG